MGESAKWVVNASPLICLGKLGHLDWLNQLASDIVIPVGVAGEIFTGPADDPARLWLKTDAAALVCAVGPVGEDMKAWDLGSGESEVLAWARGHRGYTAIIDDRAARRCADVLNIPVCGTLGILLRAKRAGLCPKLMPLLEYASRVGLYLSPVLRKEVLRLAGE
ncbi:MAG TPA: DUF3368 domain-containing protein [Opitutaceae bacterium]|nr:DUF3368 domain-containing protein [Opitutaceae bacterium]